MNLYILDEEVWFMIDICVNIVNKLTFDIHLS